MYFDAFICTFRIYWYQATFHKADAKQERKKIAYRKRQSDRNEFSELVAPALSQYFLSLDYFT